MRSIKQLLEGRGLPLSARPGDTVFQALEKMAEKEIGALLVIEGDKLVGIFSERDYARKVILKGKASKDIKVSEVMSDKIVYVTPEQTIEECMAIMTDRHCRHLPVLGPAQEVLGILSIGDLVKETISEQKFIIEQLERYITQ
jgi:CBS domain-containing protein